MKKYSEFINFPIYLWASKEVDVEVPSEEDDSTEEEETGMHVISAPHELFLCLSMLFLYIWCSKMNVLCL